MPFAWIQDVPITEDTYRKIAMRLGDEPLAGNLLHLALRHGDGRLSYVDVWESRASCHNAFEERVHPAVHGVFAEIGFTPDGEPPREAVEVIDARGSAWRHETLGVGGDA